ncbi:S8 family serine peptidase [Ectobacillus sp. JY-23]|uniref:S8 family serine peptidase n=1 Tax=Ectobacillus sp. JY-23 TaxID=2933872 RepID=UPI001FF6C3C7|nr:S8 family serine peptidase [Ectobacillus sp. JY-23]UOY92572.1 S8 family serine peptidase [Ectobacillus sp. JY-23]
MEGKWLKVLSTSFLATSLLLPNTVSTFAIEKHTTIKDVENYVAYITDAERERIQQAQINEQDGLHISPSIDTTSDKLIDVIVQFREDPAQVAVEKAAAKGKKLDAKVARDKADKAHHIFRQQLGAKLKKKAGIQVQREFRHAFNGVSMQIPANQAQELIAIDGVKAVWSNTEVHIDPPVQTDGQATSSSPAADSVEHIGAKQLHEKGVTGKGVKVGVLDTGIDYNHPDLKDVYRGGYDFINNDADPMETTYEDWKASGQPEKHPTTGSMYYTAHGTHVAGTIAGQAKNAADVAVEGVAPGVDLYAYKVLGPYGSGATGGIIAAIDRAVADGMDVINLSLGSDHNDPLDPIAIAINNASLAGTVAVIANGNNGANGLYTIGTPATSAFAISVGASDYPITVSSTEGTLAAAGGSTVFSELRLLSRNYTDNIADLVGQSLPIIAAGKGKDADYNGKDVTGKIVLIERGDIGIDQKIKTAKAKGAKAAFIYNNNPQEGHLPYYFGESMSFLPAFSMTNEQGLAMLAKLGQGATFTFQKLGEVQSQGDRLAPFSSRGPVRSNYDIKPEVTAPGVAVYSSVPAYMNGPAYQNDYKYAYARNSGTSMAAPHVAGAAALLLQKHPNYKPKDVKTALMSTADEMNGVYNVFEVGAGRIDVYEAAHAKTDIEVIDKTETIRDGETVVVQEKTGSLSFGAQIASPKGNRDERLISIANRSSKTKAFDIKVEYQKGAAGLKDGAKNGVALQVPKTFSIPSNNSKAIRAELFIPAEAEMGMYGGYVYLTNKQDPNEVYQIPFGFKKMKEGVENVTAHFKSFTTRRDMNTGYMGYTPITFSLSSPMKAVDIVLKNADTGEAMGIIEAGTGSFNEDIEYGMEFGFVGLYFPFTGNPKQPVGYSKVLAPPGRYEVEIVATNQQGKTFKKSDSFFIENTIPDIKMKQPGGIYEVDEKGLQVDGSVFDSHIEMMNKYGFNFNQSKNMVNVLNSGARPLALPLDENGNFTFQTTLNAGQDSKRTTLQVLDYSVNGIQDHPDFTYTLVKKGIPYAKITPNKHDAKYGDAVTLTLSMENIKDVLGGDFTLMYPKDTFDLQDVKLHDAFVQTAQANNMQTQLIREDAGVSGGNALVRVGALLQGTPSQSLPEDLPIVDVTLKVKDHPQSYIKWISNIQFKSAKASVWNQSIVDVKGFAQGINIIPTVSQLEGGFLPDGFMKNAWLDYGRDHSKIGAQVYAIGPDGTRYDAEVNSGARYFFKNLPLTNEAFKVIVKVPGHFERQVDVTHLMQTYKGNAAGLWTYIFYAQTMGGDVNGDHVIDIMDAIAIQHAWGTSERSADINYDGTVNAVDMQFVINHYLAVNTYVPGHTNPVDTYEGKTLDDVLRALGMQN